MCPQIIKQVDKNNIFRVTKLLLPQESNQTSLSILLSHKAIQINIFLFFPLIYIWYFSSSFKQNNDIKTY